MVVDRFFLEPPDLGLFREQARRYGFEETAYLEAVLRVPAWSRQQLDAYLLFIRELIGVISAAGLKQLREIEFRRRVEESEGVLCGILNSVPQSIFWKDRGGVYLGCNEAFAKAAGLDRPGPVVGKTDFDLPWPRSEAEAYRADDREVFAGRRPKRHIIEPLQQADGRRLWIDTTKVPLTDAEGNAYGVLGIYDDVTEQKRAEAELRTRERQLSESQRIAHIGSWQHNLKTGEIFWSDELFRLLGLDPGRDSANFQTFIAMVHPEDQPGLRRAIDATLRERTPFDMEYRLRVRDGRTCIIRAQAELLADEEGEPVVLSGTAQDITARKEAEERLRQNEDLVHEERLKTQKLESIGTLAGGIAHDFNNLLQGIFGYIAMARLAAGRPERVEAMLRQAEDALVLAVALTTQLLTFSKGGKPVRKPIRLEPVIENAARFALSGSFTECWLDVEPGLWPVEADAGQLVQVIQNVVLNANEAMTGRGTVSIAVENVQAAHGEIPGLPEGGRYVRIAIRDCGGGIAERDRERIFDPYFTTKDKGSGLGLATSYSIVKNHGGAMAVASEVGRGSTFTIHLPASADPVAAESAPATPPAAARRGRILLMDDEDLVRNVAREMVEALGHEVHCAADGAEAVEIFRRAREDGRPFDVVILDLTIRGGMGGAEAVGKLRKLDPGLVAVVSSGYADNAIMADFAAHGFSALLSKPYNFESLRSCLDALLARP